MVDNIAPAGVHPVVGPELAVDLLDDLAEELGVLALLDLVVGHAQSLHAHRRVALAVVRDEKEPHDLRATLVEARIGLHVQLLAAAYDRPAAPDQAPLLVSHAAVLVDLVLRFHAERDCWAWELGLGLGFALEMVESVKCSLSLSLCVRRSPSLFFCSLCPAGAEGDEFGTCGILYELFKVVVSLSRPFYFR